MAQGAVQGWQVPSVVRPHFPEGQLATQEVPSKKVVPSHVKQVVALDEQATHGARHA